MASGGPSAGSPPAKALLDKLKPGDNAVGIAGQMTLEIRQMMRGENAPGAVKGFSRQLDYPKSGLA